MTEEQKLMGRLEELARLEGEREQIGSGTWKRDVDGFEAECECGLPVSDFKLIMNYVHQLEVLDSMPTKVSYGGHKDYSAATELKCPCGKVYKEGTDYLIAWTEQDYVWIWSLELDMAVEDDR